MKHISENEDGTPRAFPRDALCFLLTNETDISADLWFSDNSEETQEAADICFECPVRLECLKQAVQNKEPFGVWGGLTPEQRFKNNRHRAFSSLKGLKNE